MFRVVWLQSALDELTLIWIGADSPTRQAVTAATNAIDQALAVNPEEQGESREEGERILISFPLGVLFDISGNTVHVLHVWLIQQRP
jgi:hypothetical protein